MLHKTHIINASFKPFEKIISNISVFTPGPKAKSTYLIKIVNLESRFYKIRTLNVIWKVNLVLTRSMSFQCQDLLKVTTFRL